MKTYTIQEVANLINIPVTTMRYYAKEGLFPFVERGENNYHIFKESDLGWVHFAIMLRKTGMPLKAVKNYEELTLQGESSVPQRIDILAKQKENVLSKITELQKQAELIDSKIARYQDVIKGIAVDQWTPEHYDFKLTD